MCFDSFSSGAEESICSWLQQTASEWLHPEEWHQWCKARLQKAGPALLSCFIPSARAELFYSDCSELPSWEGAASCFRELQSWLLIIIIIIIPFYQDGGLAAHRRAAFWDDAALQTALVHELKQHTWNKLWLKPDRKQAGAELESLSLSNAVCSSVNKILRIYSQNGDSHTMLFNKWNLQVFFTLIECTQSCCSPRAAVHTNFLSVLQWGFGQ